MGSKKTIIRAVLSVVVIFVLFAVINTSREVSNDQDHSVFENDTAKTESETNSHLIDSPKTDFSSQSEDSVSSNISSDSQGGIVPRIADFLQTGKMEAIRDLSREDIRIAVEAYVSMQSSDQLAEALHQYLGMPYDLFYLIEKPEDYLVEMVDLVREDIEKPLRLTNIIITDACSKDGAVSGATDIIPEGTSKIFAVFENSDALQGMENVYAVWRNLNDDSLTFSEYEPLRMSSSYNYIWLEAKGGWKRGAYQLDLADPASPSRILASTKFKIQ